MGVVHGPGHMEVKYTTTGPCLVEVGTRCHGGEGTWQPIAQECLGYNQVGAGRVWLGTAVRVCLRWALLFATRLLFSAHGSPFFLESDGYQSINHSVNQPNPKQSINFIVH